MEATSDCSLLINLICQTLFSHLIRKPADILPCITLLVLVVPVNVGHSDILVIGILVDLVTGQHDPKLDVHDCK